MMRRRSLLVGLVATAIPISLHAQKPHPKVARIGYLTIRAVDLEKRWLAAFLQGLQDLGYREGKNFIVEQRHSDGRKDKLAEYAAELVRMKVDVLVAPTADAAIAARRATQSIPIVSLTPDPVAIGLVASLARPGGNVTGVSDHHAAMGAKRLEMLQEIAPAATRIAVFYSSENPIKHLNEAQGAAAALKVKLDPIDIKRAEDIDRAFERLAKERIGALALLPAPVISSQMKRIAELALEHRIAAIYTVALWAELGGLLSYGTDFYAYYRRAATYVDKILKGAKPAELPIEEPTRFELVVNMKTARALGVTIPQTILVRADRVIE